jgi:hypothetical protein
MENEMKEIQEKIEEMKKEKGSLFVSSRRTHIVTPGCLKQNELKAQQMTPTTRSTFLYLSLMLFFIMLISKLVSCIILRKFVFEKSSLIGLEERV